MVQPARLFYGSGPEAVRLSVFAVMLLSTGVAWSCEYDERHSSGAVSLPSGWDVRLPFEEGEKVRVIAGYGPSAGSSLHCRAQDSTCANDYYALDLNLPDHSDSGRGQPVLAVADGTVLEADWATEGWANYGPRVYIRHEPGDGHVYTTMYAHLDSIGVSEGASVKQGDEIGTLGRSCMESDECSSFSTPHVHFSMHRDAGFGGSGAGGSYGGRAVIAEPIDGESDISLGDDFVSSNGGEVEDPDPDPELCQVVAGSILQEDGDCVTLTGEDYRDIDGQPGHAWWSEIDVPSPDYADGVIWTFEASDTFDVWVFVPEGLSAPTRDAIYKVSHASGSEKAHLDHGVESWNFLGSFTFSGESWVRVGDTYEQEGELGRQLAFDALRFELPGTVVDPLDSGDPEPTDSDTSEGDDDRQPKDLSDTSEGRCGCGGGPHGVFLALLALLGLWRRQTR